MLSRYTIDSFSGETTSSIAELKTSPKLSRRFFRAGKRLGRRDLPVEPLKATIVHGVERGFQEIVATFDRELEAAAARSEEIKTQLARLRGTPVPQTRVTSKTGSADLDIAATALAQKQGEREVKQREAQIGNLEDEKQRINVSMAELSATTEADLEEGKAIGRSYWNRLKHGVDSGRRSVWAIFWARLHRNIETDRSRRDANAQMLEDEIIFRDPPTFQKVSFDEDGFLKTLDIIFHYDERPMS